MTDGMRGQNIRRNCTNLRDESTAQHRIVVRIGAQIRGVDGITAPRIECRGTGATGLRRLGTRHPRGVSTNAELTVTAMRNAQHLMPTMVRER